MKTLGYKLKATKKITITYVSNASIGGHLDLSLFTFYVVKKKTTNRDNEQKFNLNLREEVVEDVGPYFDPQKKNLIPPFQMKKKGVCDLFLLRLGKK